MRRAISMTLATAIALTPTFALAHTGHAETNALLHGFAHPITGIDHVLTMIAVGVLATQFSGRAVWLIPLSFIAIMAAGGALGMAGILLPFTELGVAASVVVLGLAIAFPFRLRMLAAVALAGLFALFHGQVHGAEIPAAASGLYYTTGFIAATALLHATGIGLGLLCALKTRTAGKRAMQVGGGGVALFGAAVLIGAL